MHNTASRDSLVGGDITVYPREQRAIRDTLGTTSRMFRSRNTASMQTSTSILRPPTIPGFTVIQAIAGQRRSRNEVRRIERDEAGLGIWYLKLTKACASCVGPYRGSQPERRET